MQIIPVIDLMNGHVVHARQGLRKQYRPIQTSLCESSEPRHIIDAFLDIFPFKDLYIADLNAIADNGNNNDIIDALHKSFPTLTYWVDRGTNTCEEFLCCQRQLQTQVIGTESGISVSELNKIHETNTNFILSLDFNNQAVMGDPALLKHTEIWPSDIIIMSLNCVGSESGPDISLLNNFNSSNHGKNIYMAGGIRGQQDILYLKEKHVVKGILLATALHNKQITATDILLIN